MKPITFPPNDDQALCGQCLSTFPAQVWKDLPGDGYERSCPQCSGNLFLIDSSILPTIILLNQKGYPTKFCCSGHEKASFVDKNNKTVFYDTAPYIFFTHELTPEMGTPKGFYRDESRYHGDTTIRGSLNKQKPISEQILKLNKNLLQWAKKLAPRKK